MQYSGIPKYILYIHLANLSGNTITSFIIMLIQNGSYIPGHSGTYLKSIYIHLADLSDNIITSFIMILILNGTYIPGQRGQHITRSSARVRMYPRGYAHYSPGDIV